MSLLNAIELQNRPVLLNKVRGSVMLENRKHISKRPTQSEKKSSFFGGEGDFGYSKDLRIRTYNFVY